MTPPPPQELQDMEGKRMSSSNASPAATGPQPRIATEAEPAAGFTPGPWITETTARFVWIGPPKASGAKVADVVTYIEVEGLTDSAEAKVFANARLIAAAPDLLRAATMAADKFDEYAALHAQKGTEEGNAKARTNAYMAFKCREAIAKATDPDRLNKMGRG